MKDPRTQHDKNTRILLIVFGMTFVMVGLTFASVPLYRMFCQVTGFGGTTQVGGELPTKVLDRQFTVRFNGDTSPDLPWVFEPGELKTTVKLGQQGLTAFHARSRAPIPTSGTALYNVTPERAGKYFHKIQCFCFDQQTLQPGQDVQMPVVFYIDPSLADDREMDEVKSITLSYTFFPADSKELDDALEGFYNAGEPAKNGSATTQNN